MGEILEGVWRRIKKAPYKRRVLVISIAVVIGSLSIDRKSVV